MLGTLVAPADRVHGQVIEEWVARYNGPSSAEDVASGLTVDSSGNVFVTGWSRGVGTGHDYATIKYGPQGNRLWVNRYDGPNGADGANALAVDGAGNCYVTGGSVQVTGGMGCTTIKYAPYGTQRWVERYNGPSNGADGASAVAVDGTGNVYVTGWSTGSGISLDYGTVKYDPEGNELWVARYNRPVNGNDIASDVAVDAAGNVYVTGESYGGEATGWDYTTIKYPGEAVGAFPPGSSWSPAPQLASLLPNVPNPFNPSTEISCDIAASDGEVVDVRLEVFDLRGRRAAVLIDGARRPGTYTVRWDGTNEAGTPMPSGIYFYRLRTGEFTATRKMTLLK